jgi:hypothetical protein
MFDIRTNSFWLRFFQITFTTSSKI